MIYTKTEALLLGRKNTIDLKYILAKEYTKKVEKDDKIYLLKNFMKKALIISSIIWFIYVCLVGWGVIVPKTHWNFSESKITYENLINNSSIKPPFKIYHQLKDQCFAQKVKNKEHCIKVWLSIAYAESSWKDYKTPFWLQSKEKWFRKWVSSYKKYWYKAKNGFFFYGDWGKLWLSRYCTSEESSGSTKWCPNGRINWDYIYNNLHFK